MYERYIILIKNQKKRKKYIDRESTKETFYYFSVREREREREGGRKRGREIETYYCFQNMSTEELT